MPTIVDALGMWNGWHAEHGFDGPTGDAKLDLALADALRMMIYLREPRAQMRWIERELRDMRVRGRACNEYETAMIRWWLDLWDEHGEKALRKRNVERIREFRSLMNKQEAEHAVL